MFDQITTVVITVAIAALVGGGAYLVHRARASAREFSRLAFGTDSLREGIERMNYEHEHTPKSVSSATSLYLPRIHADFPEFDFEDMRARAENVIVSYLMAIDAQDASLLVEGSDELVDALRMKIDLLKDARQSEQYDKVSVHRTAISRRERMRLERSLEQSRGLRLGAPTLAQRASAAGKSRNPSRRATSAHLLRRARTAWCRIGPASRRAVRREISVRPRRI